MKLLIVDDSKILRRAIQQVLEENLLEWREASNGQEALEVFESFPAELVTMDITMPEMDGLECVSAMVQRRPEVRILVISALADEETAIEAVERGAQGYVCKPFTDAELKEAFNELRNRI